MTFHRRIKMTPGSLRQMPGNGDAVQVLTALGIGTSHELYLDYGSTDPAVSNGRLLYCAFPESGPMPALQRWAQTELDVGVWDLPPWDGGKSQLESMRTQADASLFVLNAALDEVAAEGDLPEGVEGMTERGEALNTNGRIMWFDDLNGVGEETNDHRFLSNFYVGEPITMPDGDVFATGEHAFAAYKAADRRAFHAIANAESPGAAKGMGRVCTLRDDWEVIKLDAMAAATRAKFTLDRAEGIWLLETGDALLIEGTYWQDRVWGVDLHVAADRRDPMQAPGRNWLGTLFMARRAELRAHKQMGWSHNTGTHNADFFA